MSAEVAEWKGRQRSAMAQQLLLEEESLKRLEEAAAANEADAIKGSVHGGMFGGSEIDESMFDAPNMVKVSLRVFVLDVFVLPQHSVFVLHLVLLLRSHVDGGCSKTDLRLTCCKAPCQCFHVSCPGLSSLSSKACDMLLTPT